MKKMKKMIALLIAAVMVVSMMSVTAFADPAPVDNGTYDATLTVNGTADGDVLNFYKVVEWVDNASGNVKGWKAVSPFDNVLDEATLKSVLGVDTTATNITPAIAAALADIARTSDQVSAVYSGSNTTLDTTVAGRGPGIYMVLINPADTDTAYNPVFVSSDFNTESGKEGTISTSESYADSTAKKSTTSLEKTAMTSEDVWDALEDGKAQWTTTAIGDTVTFTVVTTLPGYGEAYKAPHFAVKDKLHDMTLVEDSVVVTDPATLVKDDQYTVQEGTDNFTLTFNPAYLKTNKTPTKVTITYKAIVATTAALHVNTEKNEVSTEFSHTPTSEDDYSFKKDTTQHYTFTIDASGLGGDSTQTGYKTSEIVKVGRNADGTPITSEKVYSQIDQREYKEGPLEGAEFGLYTDDECNNEYIPKNADGTLGTALALKSRADGRFEIKGLDAGTYYLKETKAPAGYVKDSAIHKIEITAETKSVPVTEYTKDGETWISVDEYNALSDTAKAEYKSYTYDTDVLSKYTVKIDGKETATYNFTNKGTDAEIDWTVIPPVEKPFDIINTKGVELPSTGGIGTTMFYIVGAALVIGAGIILVTRRRMSAR